ncbi:MAG TPA: DUF294 nucleotidyltransferase-like domain-containing protein, partial [Bacteroidota bacterium]
MAPRSSLKARFDRTMKNLVAAHRRGMSGTRIAIALTRRLDELVEAVYAQSDNSEKKNLALVALGGYGRRELCFASDTDIMFLVRSEHAKEAAAGVLKELLHALLDCGLHVGHSFRTVDECVALAGTDLDSWTSMLDGRSLCGNRSVFADFRRALKRHIADVNKR